jgi:hypothetical protein
MADRRPPRGFPPPFANPADFGQNGFAMADITNATLYEHDFYAWANEQAGLLRAGRLSELDIENLAEEIESMGRSEKRELTSRLQVLTMHLLKWQFQPGLRSTSWRLTIEEQRIRLSRHLAENPSLKAELHDAIGSAYRLAILAAARETGLDVNNFPTACPWSFAKIADSDFFPDQP